MGLPADAIYVSDGAAPNGTGSRAQPYDDLNTALANHPNMTVAVDLGSYGLDAALVTEGEHRIVGACVLGTDITVSRILPATSVLEFRNTAATLTTDARGEIGFTECHVVGRLAGAASFKLTRTLFENDQPSRINGAFDVSDSVVDVRAGNLRLDGEFTAEGSAFYTGDSAMLNVSGPVMMLDRAALIHDGSATALFCQGEVCELKNFFAASGRTTLRGRERNTISALIMEGNLSTGKGPSTISDAFVTGPINARGELNLARVVQTSGMVEHALGSTVAATFDIQDLLSVGPAIDLTNATEIRIQRWRSTAAEFGELQAVGSVSLTDLDLMGPLDVEAPNVEVTRIQHSFRNSRTCLDLISEDVRLFDLDFFNCEHGVELQSPNVVIQRIRTEQVIIGVRDEAQQGEPTYTIEDAEFLNGGTGVRRSRPVQLRRARFRDVGAIFQAGL